METRTLLSASVLKIAYPPASANVNSLSVAGDGTLWSVLQVYPTAPNPTTTPSPQLVVDSVTPTGQVTHHALPSGYGVVYSLAAEPDGSAWVAAEIPGTPTGDNLSALIHLTASGQSTLVPLPSGTRVGTLAAAPDDSLWALTTDANLISLSLLHRAADGKLTTTPLPYTSPLGNYSDGDMAVDRQGIVWFVSEVPSGNRDSPTEFLLNRRTTDGRITSVHPGVLHTAARGKAPSTTMPIEPRQLTTGPDGKIWFLDLVNDGYLNGIARVGPAGKITRFPLALPDQVEPNMLAAGPGNSLTFGLYKGNVVDGYLRSTLGHISTSGRVSYEAFAQGDMPVLAAGGSDRSLWYLLQQSTGASLLVRVAPAGGKHR